MRKALWGIAIAATAATAAPVYRCDQGGKTAYSDAPCIGAKEVDVTPTEGLNKWTGSEKTAPDLTLKRMSKTNTDAIAKAVGMAPKQIQREVQRGKLTEPEKAECRKLDQVIAQLKSTPNSDESTLYQARARYFKLKC